MSNPHGRFVWHELMTTDATAAQSFYGAVVGWGTQAGPVPEVPYTLLTMAGTPMAGLMELPAEARDHGARPGWLGYVGVQDVDASVAQAQRLGGTLHVPPRDIPNIGRFAVIGDPQRAVLALFTPAMAEAGGAPAPCAPGSIGWNELQAADGEAAFDFYARMFGWQKAEAMDMGPMGTYQLFGLDGPPIGGMFTKPPTVPAPCWLYYVRVADIDAAAGRVQAAGGQVVHGPAAVPGDDWIIQGLDPQGALFALVGKRG